MFKSGKQTRSRRAGLLNTSYACHERRWRRLTLWLLLPVLLGVLVLMMK